MTEREKHNLAIAKNFFEQAKKELKTKKRRIIKKRALQKIEESRLFLNKYHLRNNDLARIKSNNYDKNQQKYFIKTIDK